MSDQKDMRHPQEKRHLVNYRDRHGYPLYGLMAEYNASEDLIKAVDEAYAAGYRVMDAYTPYPVEGLADALGHRAGKLAPVVLAGGLLGAAVGYGMQYFASVIHYPLNVGGRPLHSWPAFIPITFELTILFAAFAAVLGMFALNGLPQPYHPVFNTPNFEMATRSHFFLAIEARDPRFDPVDTREFLEATGPNLVSEIPQ
jgi:hypothetical protein